MSSQESNQNPPVSCDLPQASERNIDELSIHEFCKFLPPATPQEDEALVQSIREHGVLLPCDILADGTILDGARRRHAAKKAGLTQVPTRIVAPTDIEHYIISVNVDRRHLSEGQRAVLALRWQKHRSAELKTERATKAARGKQHKQSAPSTEKGPKKDSHKEACDRFAISSRTLARVRTIAQKRPAALDDILTNDTSPLVIMKNIRAEAATQRADAADLMAQPIVSDDIFCMENKILCGDSIDILGGLDAGVASLILTSPFYCGVDMDYDPPLPPLTYLEYLDYLRRLFKQMVRVLRSGGRVAINVDITRNKDGDPHYMYPICMHVMQIAEEVGLHFWNEIAWDKDETAGSKTAWGSYGSCSSPIIQRSHESVLIFYKDTNKLDGDDAHCDLRNDEFVEWTRSSTWRIRPEGREIRKHHPCPFPEELAARFIKLFTYKGDLVIDPHNGSGTTTFCAERLGRRYLGADVSDKYCQFATARIADRSRKIRWQSDRREDVRDSYGDAFFHLPVGRPSGDDAEAAAAA